MEILLKGNYSIDLLPICDVPISHYHPLRLNCEKVWRDVWWWWPRPVITKRKLLASHSTIMGVHYPCIWVDDLFLVVWGWTDDLFAIWVFDWSLELYWFSLNPTQHQFPQLIHDQSYLQWCNHLSFNYQHLWSFCTIHHVDQDILLDASVPISCLLCQAHSGNNCWLLTFHVHGYHYHVCLR